MIGNDQDIDNYFKEYIFGFMINDVEKAIDSGLNYIAALGLATYTEIIGGLMTGKLRERNASRKNFEKFLEYLPPYYQQNNIKRVFYEKIRCGLVHEYFVKEVTTDGDKGLIARVGVRSGKDSFEDVPGVIIDKIEGRVFFFLRNYFRDFKLAVKRYYTQLVINKEKLLIDNFKIAVEK